MIRKVSKLIYKKVSKKITPILQKFGFLPWFTKGFEVFPRSGITITYYNA
jgi:hypothetical protein